MIAYEDSAKSTGSLSTFATRMPLVNPLERLEPRNLSMVEAEDKTVKTEGHYHDVSMYVCKLLSLLPDDGHSACLADPGGTGRPVVGGDSRVRLLVTKDKRKYLDSEM